MKESDFYKPGQIVYAFCSLLEGQYVPAVILKREAIPPKGIITYTVAGIGESFVLSQGQTWLVTGDECKVFEVNIPMPPVTN